MSYAVLGSTSNGRACNCMGAQPGMPACPCMMPNFIQRDGRWVRKERDFGPIANDPVDRFTLNALTCPKCRIRFEGAMGFVCGNSDCPVQLQVTA